MSMPNVCVLLDTPDLRGLTSARLKETERALLARSCKWFCRHFGSTIEERARRAQKGTDLTLGDIMETALRKGCLPVVQWAHKRGMGIRLIDYTLAGSSGDLELIEWMYDTENLFANKVMLDSALRHGHMEIIRWAAQQPYWNGFHVSNDTTTLTAEFIRLSWTQNVEMNPVAIMNSICATGSLELADWAWKNVQSSITDNAFRESNGPRHLRVTKWMFERGIGRSNALFHALNNGDAESVRWLVGKGFKLPSRSWNWILCSGDLALVEWAMGTEIARDCWSGASSSRDVAFLDGLKRLGMTLTEPVLRGAMVDGNLVMLKWASANFANFEETLAMVDWPTPNYGDPEVLRWLFENWDFSVTLKLAIRTKDAEFVKAVYERAVARSPMAFDKTSVSAVLRAVNVGCLEVLRYLEQQGFRVTSDVFQVAAEIGYRHILEWGVNAGYQFSRPQCTRRAIHSGEFHLVRWFVETLGWRVCSVNCREFVQNHCSRIRGSADLVEWLVDWEMTHGLNREDAQCVLAA